MPYVTGTLYDFEGRLHTFCNNVGDLEDFITEYASYFDADYRITADDGADVVVGGGDVNTYPPIEFYAEYWSSNVSPALAYFYHPINSFPMANTSQTPITINNITITGGASLSVAGGFPFTLSATPFQWNNPNSYKILTVNNINQLEDGNYIPGANLSDVISVYADGYTLPFIINY